MGGVLGGHYSMGGVLGGHYCQSLWDTTLGGVLGGHHPMSPPSTWVWMDNTFPLLVGMRKAISTFRVVHKSLHEKHPPLLGNGHDS